ASSLVIPTFLQSCNGRPLSDTAESYLDHFEVTRDLLQKVISTAMEKGADYADLFFEHTIENASALEDKKVNSAYSTIGYGVGIRVLKGDQTGFAYTENISAEAMLKAAKTAANIADSSSGFKHPEINEYLPPSYYKVNASWETSSVKDKIPFIQRLNDKIFAADKRVSNVNAYLVDSTSYILFFNSEGLITWDYRPMVFLGGVCIMEENGRIENFFVGRSLRKGSEFLTNELVDELSEEAVKKTSLLFAATKPKGGEMEVVVGAGDSGILLHEAMGHAFEADFNRKNLSIFSDKMGKKVAENFVTIIDDGTVPGMRGTINCDDEGNPSAKTTLVSNGILSSYLHDRISAKFYNVAPTGNGRREDFRNIPIPRMRTTYMESGPHKREEIIASVKNGVYVESFSNGEVNIGQGDFTFFVKYGSVIENGKLTRPVKDFNIIGNGPQALADIEMVADDLLLSNGVWTCGKNGQGAPVSMGIPTVKIKKLTVGGINS
ncbi:MAG TPA: metallopeptidase TldD-related protein, partial [Prolixibacteraceae bacterium]|nr:metallopeptidase TldD-related protein [Prolixibacteraceae bacterium]